ncbi:MAG: hypothetical protein IIT90_06030 [Clostridiales bacterium]|nr:hypothetical protein [Clostridiales bacterium]
MKKKVFAVIALFLCVSVFAGCADKGIQGKWELYEEIESDGNKISKKELDDMRINEIYEIEGDAVHYTCSIPGASKDIKFDMKLTDKGDNRYEFILMDKITFASVEVQGNTMTYYSGTDGDMTKMVFKRSK